MFVDSPSDIEEDLISSRVQQHVFGVAGRLKSLADKRTESILPQMAKVLKAFSAEKVGTQHFSYVTGYGHDDQGREVIDRVFARVLRTEKAAVRTQFVSGTHAIAASLFGALRPGDTLLSITGKPYETLEEVIGLRGNGSGSLIDFGISYKELRLRDKGEVDFQALEDALKDGIKMVFIQRSCGYSWRPSLTVDTIGKVCRLVHHLSPNTICFVDNCYGEFVEEKEPSEVGADLIAGSLIKNLGGTIVPAGAYVAGRAVLVEKACCRLTSPGIGSKGGTTFDLNRLILQGLFLAPQMVAESLIGADLLAGVFQDLGFLVNPTLGAPRGDLIQSVRLGSPEALKIVCQAIQSASPVGSYLDPVPANMPGYENNLLMAGGTFIDGSTSELSADAPLKSPYNLYVQGGTHHSHMKLALVRALLNLVKAGQIQLPK